MELLASVGIFHWPSGVQLHTIPEKTSSEIEAKNQFSKLSDIISMMNKDNDNIVLETTEGYVSLTRKYLSDCVLNLEVKLEEEPNDYDG